MACILSVLASHYYENIFDSHSMVLVVRGVLAISPYPNFYFPIVMASALAFSHGRIYPRDNAKINRSNIYVALPDSWY